MNQSSFNVDDISLLDFLKQTNTLLKVPDYQRGYSWEKTQLIELMTDIDAITDSDYLIGSMIFIKRDNERLEIVDGQQRLATFYILLNELHNYFKQYAEHNERAENERDRVKGALYDIDNSGSRIYKLELGGFDKRYFEKLICKEIDTLPEKTYQSNKLIYETKKIINEKLSEIDSQKGLAGLLELADKIKKIIIIRIDVSNEGDAYVIFESINDRGANLTVADLLKNFLIKIAHLNNDNVEIVKENWEKVITTLGELKITDLLTYYWRARKENVTSNRLFKAIKSHVEDENYSPRQFTDELVAAAVSFRKIEFPEEYSLNSKLIDLLRGVRITGFKQWYPMIMASFIKKVDDDLMCSLLSNMEKLSVYLKISEFNPSQLESNYVIWAKRILQNGQPEIPRIINEFNKELPPIEIFNEKFVTKSYDTNTAKLVLIRIEQKIGGTDVNLDFDAYEIEHIMPKTLSSGWNHIDETQVEEYLNDIGNLTLLAKVQNIRSSNKKYKDKQLEYASSRVIMTSKLAKSKNQIWDFDSIEDRGKGLLTYIEQIWPYNTNK